MVNKIVRFLREFIIIFSVIAIIVGSILISMGVLWYGFYDFVKDTRILDFIYVLENWNAYLLIIGLIIFGFGVYYFYSFFIDRKFVLEELLTDKRSDFLKKHYELKNTVKKLPSKYQKMLKEKEQELKIK